MTSEANGKIVVPIWSDDGDAKPLVDDNGRVPVSVGASVVTQDVNIKSSDITVPVAEQSPLTSIQAQLYGWDLSNWRKLPLLWGITDIVLGSANATATGAGSFSASLSAVPSGYIYVYTQVGVAQVTGASADVQVGIHISGLYYWVQCWQSCGNSRWYGGQTNLILTEGHNLLASTVAVAVDDLLYLRATGYSMKVNE